MSRAEQIYPLQRRIRRELSIIESDRCNREILTRYYKVRTTEVRPATVVNELIRLNMMSKLLGKRFEDATVNDMEELVYNIDRKGNMPNTINKFRKILKNFYRWMRGCPMRDYPPEVRWIRLKKVPLVTVRPEDLLSYDECLKITEFATNLRDRALFQCTLDAGCRIGEILTVRIGEVEFNEGGAILRSEGKTGAQPCILTWSAGILANWMNNHPFKGDPRAPLWPRNNRARPEPMSYFAARTAFGKCVRRSGCKKRVWLHLLRHVSSTEDAMNGMPDSFRKYKHHWAPNSRMSAVYEHLSQSIIPKIQSDSWMRLGVEKAGRVESSKTVSPLVTCRRCSLDNPRDSIYCSRCAFPLKESEVIEMSLQRRSLEDVLKKIREDPEKLEKLLAIIR